MTEDQLNAMRNLWEQHPELTAEVIGNRFGLSKNAVIGQAHRRQWAARGKVDFVETRVMRMGRLAAKSFPALGRCSFASGHRDEKGFRFCGDPVDPGSPYCARHRAICIAPPPPSKKPDK